jgi:Zn-dependent protease with chaperone function
LLAWGVAARFRNWAEAASGRRFLQALLFVPLCVLTVDLAGLPLDVYAQRLELQYAQSVQSWLSWFWDWSKEELITLGLGVPLVWLGRGILRRSPRRWWLYTWLAALPVLFALVFLAPLVFDPLFFDYAPLQEKRPGLVPELQKVAARGGLAIPAGRMFEMKASEKLKSLNAYVTGLGATKRVVVWDTTIQLATVPQIQVIFGHELGHYVMGHVRNTLILVSGLLLVLLFLSHHALGWLLPRWGIRGPDDLAALPALVLLIYTLLFLGEPLSNSYSRWQERRADAYGLEVVRGLVENPGRVAADTFQMLGEIGLEDPAPPAFIEFWMYTHPPVGARMAAAQK